MQTIAYHGVKGRVKWASFGVAQKHQRRRDDHKRPMGAPIRWLARLDHLGYETRQRAAARIFVAIFDLRVLLAEPLFEADLS